MINSKYKSLFFPILIALFIFIASHQSKFSVPEFGFKFEDIIVHVFVYGIFVLSMMYSILKINPLFPMLKLRYIVTIIGILYGATDEFHQSFTPGRFCDIYDLIADSVGVIIAIIIYPYLSRRTLNV